MAGVARSTVYLVFGSRAGLFDAVGRDSWSGRLRGPASQAVGHPDAREHMRGGIAAGARMFAAERDVARALYSMAQLDPEAVGGAIAAHRERAVRRDAAPRPAPAEQGLLRDDVTVEDAATPCG